MADNATRALWCIVQGDPEAFQVTVSVNDNFGHVKKRIKEEAFDNYTLARKLVLWKVSPSHSEGFSNLRSNHCATHISPCSLMIRLLRSPILTSLDF